MLLAETPNTAPPCTDYFVHMTDEQFNSWLAGFFDGEGCIYVSKVSGMEASVSQTRQDLIYQVRCRLKLGTVHTTTFKNQKKWHTKYSLRMRNIPEIKQFLHRVRPFLTIKAAKADAALQKIAESEAKEANRRSRNAEIWVLRAQGLTHKQIADRFGMNRSNVSTILGWMQQHGNTSHPGKRTKAKDCWSVQSHTKPLVHVETSTVKDFGYTA